VRSICGANDNGFCNRRGAACGAEGCPVLERVSDIPMRTVDEVDRRAFLAQAKVAGVVAAGALVIGGSGAVVGRLLGGSASAAKVDLNAGGALDDSSASSSVDPAAPTTAGSAPTGGPTTVAPPPAGKAIGAASKVPVGGSATFTDPKSLDPGIVVQPTAGTFVAFDASCTHEGCPVDYSKTAKCLVCPCHGAQFDSSTGAVIRGPARRPLAKISVAEGADGKLYVGG
jgi:Rieske Fe-S protein